MAFKLFRNNSGEDSQQDRQQEPAGQERPESAETSAPIKALPPREELPQHNGLPELVELMDRYDVRTLRLDQRGNEMTAVMDPSEKPERKTTVDTESTWFDAVAKLYTASQKGERGPWRRVEVMIGNAREGQRAVEIEYTYPGSDKQDREAYVQPVTADDADQDANATDGQAADSRTTSAQTADAQGLDERQGQNAQDTATAGTAGAAGAGAGVMAGAASSDADRAEDRQGETVGAQPTSVREAEREQDTTVMGTPAAEEAAAADVRESDSQVADAQTAEGRSEDQASGRDLSAERDAAPSDRDTEAGPATTSGTASVVTGAAAGGVAGAAVAGSASDRRASDADDAASSGPRSADVTPATDANASEHEISATEPVPAVVHDSSWDDEDSVEAPQAGRPSRPRGDSSLPDSAPSVAEHADVAPSYQVPETAPAKPSEKRLAEGNLVLTEAEVVNRLADAQSALFGANGTAREVSTVLIRVRALGSYYDALTHVRSNGLWDQRGTFDLIPEDALKVLDLKSDSYQEGKGSPIAMMFRFTPGIPPEVSFDYADEESYVQYKDRLPAQQYVEELRLFPRTGANIPEHMNDALTQWTL